MGKTKNHEAIKAAMYQTNMAKADTKAATDKHKTDHAAMKKGMMEEKRGLGLEVEGYQPLFKQLHKENPIGKRY